MVPHQPPGDTASVAATGLPAYTAATVPACIQLPGARANFQPQNQPLLLGGVAASPAPWHARMHSPEVKHLDSWQGVVKDADHILGEQGMHADWANLGYLSPPRREADMCHELYDFPEELPEPTSPCSASSMSPDFGDSPEGSASAVLGTGPNNLLHLTASMPSTPLQYRGTPPRRSQTAPPQSADPSCALWSHAWAGWSNEELQCLCSYELSTRDPRRRPHHVPYASTHI